MKSIHQIGVWTVRIIAVLFAAIAIVFDCKNDWELIVFAIMTFLWLDDRPPEDESEPEEESD